MTHVVKTFCVPGIWLNRRMPRILNCLNSLNSRRIRGSRRGRWLMSGVDASKTEHDPRLWSVSVTLRMSGTRPVPFYKHNDIGKVLKDLTVAHNKHAARHAEPPEVMK